MLSDYDITIEHRSGVKHQNADALSRLIADDLSSDDHTGARLDGSPVTSHDDLTNLTPPAITNLALLQKPQEWTLQRLPNGRRQAVGWGLCLGPGPALLAAAAHRAASSPSAAALTCPSPRRPHLTASHQHLDSVAAPLGKASITGCIPPVRSTALPTTPGAPITGSCRPLSPASSPRTQPRVTLHPTGPGDSTASLVSQASSWAARGLVIPALTGSPFLTATPWASPPRPTPTPTPPSSQGRCPMSGKPPQAPPAPSFVPAPTGGSVTLTSPWRCGNACTTSTSTPSPSLRSTASSLTPAGRGHSQLTTPSCAVLLPSLTAPPSPAVTASCLTSPASVAATDLSRSAMAPAQAAVPLRPQRRPVRDFHGRDPGPGAQPHRHPQGRPPPLRPPPTWQPVGRAHQGS